MLDCHGFGWRMPGTGLKLRYGKAVVRGIETSEETVSLGRVFSMSAEAMEPLTKGIFPSM